MKSPQKIGLLVVLALYLGSALVTAQERGSTKVRASPNASISQTIGTTDVTVTYGRPALKGRSLESLAPAGKVWRTGANESAAITFSDDVNFGGKGVKAGTYSLYTIPGNDEWIFIINSTLSWGTRYNEEMDVVRAVGTTSEVDGVESFTISFSSLSKDSANLVLSWGDVSASISISPM